MLLRNTVLYLPAQVIGPLAQLVAMVVWTHVVDEPTLGIITLVTATHELLQIAFLAWWSQYTLRFFGRYQDDPTSRFFPTENAVVLVSCLIQGLAVVVILFQVIAPNADAGLVAATIAYVVSRTLNLYIGERARIRQQIGVYTIQQVFGPLFGFAIGLLLIRLNGPAAQWPLAGYALAQFIAVIVVLPRIGVGHGVWPLDRSIIDHAARYGVPLIAGGALGWIGLNASRFVVNEMQGVAAAGLFAVGYGLGQRTAAFAAMLVTAAAFPLAVRSMERHGSKVAMRQLADNSALLIAILAPTVAGLFMLRNEIVHLLIARTFQDVTLAILPLSMLAGSIRSLRAHFVDQSFLLHNRTGLVVVAAAIDATMTVVLSLVFVPYWGLVGAAGATVVSGLAAAIVSFTIGFSKFGLRLPVRHLAQIAIATTAMAFVLHVFREAPSLPALVMHIAGGGATYVAVMTLLYAPVLLKVLRVRRQPVDS
ncbi:oligosaccharide flippase family protein [Rhodopseudomonas sp. NSM]|uniref:oligosaccharide flippase family protein n=1 Tax=Rhodopseudomonas sp. NSM TaxID=3457630 RepID=UPI004035B7E8